MANTYTQLYIQLVFAVKGRENLIIKSAEERVHKYLSGIVENCGHKLLAIGGMPDHVHIFCGLHPQQGIADLVKTVKSNSTTFIKENNILHPSFSWQGGYGAFSYSRSHKEKVIQYVLNQEEHHKKESFREEYLKMLRSFEIEYDEKYLFDWIE